MSKLVCVIAGGQWQVPLVEKLKIKGFTVLNINLYSDTPAAQLSDFIIEEDIINKDSCFQALNQYNPIAVLTDQSDIAVPTVAYIADKLGVPGIGVECASLFTNKYLMRLKASELGVLNPDYVKVADQRGAQEAACSIGYPLIVKPVNSQSSRGVSLVRDVEELKSAVNLAFQNSMTEDYILVEQFIPGEEYTVEGFKSIGGHQSLAVSYKTHYKDNPTVANTLIYEPIFSKESYAELVAINDKLIEGFGLPFGITHVEYKRYDGKFYLIEAAARGGGTNVSSHIIPLMSGVDVYDLLIDCATGVPQKAICLENRNLYATLGFLDFQPGTVKSHTSIEEIALLPFVVDFGFNFTQGSELKLVTDDRSRHAYYIIKAKTLSELYRNVEELKDKVKVYYE